MKIEPKLNLVFSLFLLCTCIFLSSCKKEDDSISDRDKLLGTYAAAETCPGATRSYDIVFTAGDEDNELLIANIYDTGENLTVATIDGQNLVIFSQLFSESGGATTLIEGDGGINETTVSINFSLTTDGDTEFCSAVCTRK